MQGAINSLSGVAAIAGPIIGTELLARLSTESASPRVPGAAFFAAAAFNAIGLMFALRLFARERAGERARAVAVE